ncbi:MAG: hypothetical protein JNJ54_00520 [Myxococcaceae bacterium]|nr:hypothetical protein [Myxococcaceae bacterium]
MKTLLFATLLSGSLAAAEVPPLHATVGLSSQLFSARGYDLLDGDDIFLSFRLAGGTTFELRRFSIDVEGAFSTGGVDGIAHAQVNSGLTLLGFEVSGTARWKLLTWLEPYVRVGVGADWATLTLFNTTRLTQTVGNVAGHAGLGVQVSARLTKPEQRGVFLVADLGAGGVLRPAYDFDAMAPAPVVGPQADPIGGRNAVNVGALPLSGITIRANVGVRF